MHPKVRGCKRGGREEPERRVRIEAEKFIYLFIYFLV